MPARAAARRGRQTRERRAPRPARTRQRERWPSWIVTEGKLNSLDVLGNGLLRARSCRLARPVPLRIASRAAYAFWRRLFGVLAPDCRPEGGSLTLPEVDTRTTVTAYMLQGGSATLPEIDTRRFHHEPAVPGITASCKQVSHPWRAEMSDRSPHAGAPAPLLVSSSTGDTASRLAGENAEGPAGSGVFALEKKSDLRLRVTGVLAYSIVTFHG